MASVTFSTGHPPTRAVGYSRQHVETEPENKPPSKFTKTCIVADDGEKKTFNRMRIPQHS